MLLTLLCTKCLYTKLIYGHIKSRMSFESSSFEYACWKSRQKRIPGYYGACQDWHYIGGRADHCHSWAYTPES